MTGNREAGARIGDPGSAAPPAVRWWDGMALVALLVGVTLRARLLLDNRALWLDEAMLALNLVERSWLGLFRPLAYDQAAPPLFLWIAKASGMLAGGSEIALRGFPFLAGVVTLALAWYFVRRLVSPAVAATTTALLAVSPPLVYYSAELKPYMSDAMVTILLVGLAAVVRLPPRAGMGWWGLAATGFVALFGSFTAPYALAVAGAILLARAWGSPDRHRSLLPIASLALAWLAVFAGLYLTLFRPAAANPYLQEFWHAAHLSNFPTPGLAVYGVATALLAPLPLPETGIRMALLLPAVLLLMLLAGWRFGWRFVLMPGLAIGLVLLSSWLRLYPIEPRLLLFLAPLTLSVIAGGAIAGLGRLTGSTLVHTLAIAGLVTSLVAWGGGLGGRGPGLLEGERLAIDRIRQRPQEVPVYVLSGAGPKYAYYTSDWNRPAPERLRWFARELSHGGAAFRGSHDAKGLESSSPGPLSRPGHPRELLAYSSGSGSGVPGPDTPTWAAAESARLLSLGTPEVWIYGGAYHRRELPLLLAALRAGGAKWEIPWRDGSDVVVVVKR